MNRRRIIRALDLVNDASLIARYQERHAPGAVWPEVIAHLRATGVIEMEIWCFANRLVMIVEASQDFPRLVPETARVSEWENEMSTFQQPLPGAPAGIKWAPMALLFKLSESGQ